MSLPTYEEKAQMYEDAIEALILNGAITSYSLPTGQSVTKAQIQELEALAQFYRRQANRSKYGIKTYADLTRGG